MTAAKIYILTIMLCAVGQPQCVMPQAISEHRIQPAMSDCLKGKRVAERTANDNIEYKCGKVKVELEENIDGSKAIKKLITE